jgi:amino acid permease
MASDPEATAHSDEKPASIRVVETDVASHTGVVAINTEDESFWTRNGLNLTSFKKRHYGPGLVDLDRSMKTRHLNMIAIGGSIGAGFFVRSGGAFHRGVSYSKQCKSRQ